MKNVGTIKKKRRIKVRVLASVCGICSEPFRPLVDHFHRISDVTVYTRIQRRHPDWEPAEEACPPCVDSALAPRKPLLSYLRLPSIFRLARA